jgi:pantetheine-phosphate adenylyltransferase
MAGSIIIYPGTFDPITQGHVDLVRRACKIFDKVVVAVAEHTSKKTLLSLEERVLLAQESLTFLSNVQIESFGGLLVDFARTQKIFLLLRGVRAISDFEFERHLAATNQHLAPEIETIFMAAAEKYAHISSTFIRDIARLGGNISEFVPAAVVKRLEKYGFNDYR